MIRSLEQQREDPHAKQTQARELDRLRRAIKLHVFDFCQTRFLFRMEFHMHEMTEHVAKELLSDGQRPPAPESVARIFRDLGQRGAVTYTLLSRRHSEYRIDAVNPSKL